MTTQPRLGYVGVGLMGLPMVKHLLPRGYAIRAYDIVPAQVEAARAAGAQPAASPADAATGVDFVLLNLPTNEAVEQAVFGERGVASALRPPQLLIDFSTIKVDKCKAWAAKLKEKTGCSWIDAPVSGGPPAAGSGALTVMAGGDPADIERARPLFADVAARLTHMGPAGAGMVAKMLNQLIVGCGHAVMAEAVVLAEAAGIDAAKLPECLGGGYADSALLQRLYPRMVARDFAPQGYARQLLKDLEMANEFAGGLKAPTPMMGEALTLYRMLVHLGHAELDTAAVLKLYDMR
jgi:3-hydroxyisobutyrate dehydrogenase-like beta-hydroxyacid dehydrogenase